MSKVSGGAGMCVCLGDGERQDVVGGQLVQHLRRLRGAQQAVDVDRPQVVADELGRLALLQHAEVDDPVAAPDVGDDLALERDVVALEEVHDDRRGLLVVLVPPLDRVVLVGIGGTDHDSFAPRVRDAVQQPDRAQDQPAQDGVVRDRREGAHRPLPRTAPRASAACAARPAAPAWRPRRDRGARAPTRAPRASPPAAPSIPIWSIAIAEEVAGGRRRGLLVDLLECLRGLAPGEPGPGGADGAHVRACARRSSRSRPMAASALASASHGTSVAVRRGQHLGQRSPGRVEARQALLGRLERYQAEALGDRRIDHAAGAVEQPLLLALVDRGQRPDTASSPSRPAPAPRRR